MITNHTEETLIKFEERVCDTFMNKEILAPVHLYSGSEKQMIDIFQNIKEQDWLFCSWRSHYLCLLKGVTEEMLMDEIKK
jgi:TPP-dependent pyruvate/acetoin dehydrogenase alpha subunit